MDFKTALEMISATAPGTPVSDAIALANAIVENSSGPVASMTSKETQIVKWISKRYSTDYLKSATTNKVSAIKEARMHFNCGLREAKEAVDWYIDHPDSMFW